MFITDAILKQAVADVLKRKGTTPLQAYWDRIVPRANKAAYDEIVGALLNRGFSLAAITSWSRAAEFQESIGLYWCGVYGAAHFQEDEGELFTEWDRREELKTVPIVVDGVLQTPTASETGPVGSGRMETGREVFRPLRRSLTTGEIE